MHCGCHKTSLEMHAVGENVKKVYIVFVWFKDILCMNNHCQYKEILTRIEISYVENKCKLFTEMS